MFDSTGVIHGERHVLGVSFTLPHKKGAMLGTLGEKTLCFGSLELPEKPPGGEK